MQLAGSKQLSYVPNQLRSNGRLDAGLTCVARRTRRMPHLPVASSRGAWQAQSPTPALHASKHTATRERLVVKASGEHLIPVDDRIPVTVRAFCCKHPRTETCSGQLKDLSATVRLCSSVGDSGGRQAACQSQTLCSYAQGRHVAFRSLLTALGPAGPCGTVGRTMQTSDCRHCGHMSASQHSV